MNKKIQKQLLKYIKKYNIITIFGHINPDCDCYSSSLALREIIRDNFPHKKVYALGSGPEYVFELFPPYDEISEDIIKQSLAIIVDCSEICRVSDERISLAKEIIKIDHHIESNEFEGFKWVDTNYIAAAMMIGDFAFESKLKVSKLAASLLYLGICTDSGRFRYSPTNGDTHRLVAKLYDIGIDPTKMFDMLYQSDGVYVKYQSHIVEKYQQTKHGVIYSFMDEKDYKKYGLTFDEVSKNVNVLGNIKGCPIWALFTRSPEGFIRVELRSKELNIQQIALKYGGGGHLHAAGVRLSPLNEWDKAKAMVKDLDLLANHQYEEN